MSPNSLRALVRPRCASLVGLALLAACSSSSSPSGVTSDATSDTLDDGAVVDTGADTTSGDVVAETSDETASDTRSDASCGTQGDCVTCQLKYCSSGITGCDTTCAGWLKCYMDCFGVAHPAACQADCDKMPMGSGTALKSCQDTNCPIACKGCE